MSAFTYPDCDPDLHAATLRGDRELHASITVCRPWRAGPDSFNVRYYLGGPDSDQWYAAVKGQRVPLDQPVKLAPVRIDKPWGHETWYTGIEARGESSVITEDGELPLFDYLNLAPERLCGRHQPVLLKILTSLAEPVIGELYFEVHDHKQEVYIVNAIDRGIYPDGIGAVRFGMNQQLRTHHGSDEAFRQAFLSAVKAYEREDPDHRDNTGNSELRTQVLSFINLQPLRQGDALVVPNGVPHALQPGLSVVEFQTPSYERQIIFASQPVVTQTGWDSASAIATMSLEPANPPRSAKDPDPVIASLDEFGVRRITLNGHDSKLLPESLPYAVALATEQTIHISCAASTLTLAQGEAAFIPGSASALELHSAEPAQLLLSGPGL